MPTLWRSRRSEDTGGPSLSHPCDGGVCQRRRPVLGSPPSHHGRSFSLIYDRAVGSEKLRRTGVYGRCLSGGWILLTQLSRTEPDVGSWTLPGGGIEGDETHHEALLREFDEETGLVPDIGDLVDVFTRVYPPNVRRGPLEVIQYVYDVEAAGEPVVREIGGSTAAAAWVDLDEIHRYPLVDLVSWAIEQ